MKTPHGDLLPTSKTNNDSGLYDVTNINKFVKECSKSMPVTKKANYV